MKQTAVEFLVELLNNLNDNFNLAFKDEIEQAKELEKQQQDDFAIEFSEWCLNSLLNGEEPKAETMKELLEIFKNK
jgi:hypothetical protein